MNDFAPYADLRSPARGRNRTTTDLKKYYSYKALGRNQRIQPHYVLPCYSHSIPDCRKCFNGVFPAKMSAVPVRPLTKREYYEEAQAWPKPPHRHHAYPKRETEWGCKRGSWARRWQEGKAVRRELKHVNDVFEDELADDDAGMALSDSVWSQIWAQNDPDTRFCGPRWAGDWDLPQYTREEYRCIEGVNGRANAEDRESVGETEDEAEAFEIGRVESDRESDWDVLSEAAEMSAWEPIEEEEEWLWL
jgi:hypothetical protein